MRNKMKNKTLSQMKYEAARFKQTDAHLERVMANFDDATGEEVVALLELIERFAAWHLDSHVPIGLNRAEFIEQLEDMLSWFSEKAHNSSGAV